jgi:nucleotide-binding universal stress UspA family protein
MTATFNILKIKTILLPLDGSKRSERALPVVRQLATALGAQVKLLHIIERHPPSSVHGESHLGSVDEATRYLDTVSERMRSEGVTVELHVHDEPEQDITQSIASHAAELDADLVVLVAHGTGGWRNLLFGRVAQQVALRGSRPALVLQDLQDGTIAPFPPKVVALPLDGPMHTEGEAVIPAAAAIATAIGASLRLITVISGIEFSSQRGPVSTLLPSATRALSDIEEAAAVDYLDGWITKLRGAGIESSAVVVHGEPAEKTIHEAERSGADLLAIVTHPRSPLSGMLSGSVGARALTRFQGSLLIVRSPDEDQPRTGD